MILTLGETLIDMIVSHGDHLSLKPIPGGSPFNTAIALSRLDVPVGFMGNVSRDPLGNLILEQLISNGVDTRYLHLVENPSTLALVHPDEAGEAQYGFYIDGTAAASFSPADIPPQLPECVRALVFGSIALVMEPLGSTLEEFLHRERTGRLLSFDPNVRPALMNSFPDYFSRYERILSLSTIVKLSQEDLHYLYPSQKEEEVIHGILSQGPRLIIVTRGEKGASAFKRTASGIDRVDVPSVPTPIVDTVGAGDTFHGAFLAWLAHHDVLTEEKVGMLSEGDIFEALLFASRAASLVCTRAGADPPTLVELHMGERNT
ncbi:PfkB domain protein [Spirochaeta thermophila DSM 6578]|uniref:PfkB domain protein n=1 Tax=Winmispira thermophila (strain ATCC 700085 / DSM 6578 / Z-1203) TaxID=869211 RepID=G0GEL7_WINT7|nr:carbohydrate kinase [Spirochaeta thermophila]AEJ60705.1 PfkB domain protein [Spirochaeta thermophila DSM 6578]